MEKIQSEDSQGEQNGTQSVISKKKYAHSKKHNLNAYNKRQILEHIQQNGYDEEIIKKFYKVESSEIKEYIDKLNKKAQQEVKQNCDTIMFKNIEKWLEYFTTEDYDKNCKFEIPMMLKIIAESEVHPPAIGDEDIDFKNLYNFLSDIMRGYPPRCLNSASKAFLLETFNELLEAVNSRRGLAHLEKFQNSIKLEPEDQDSLNIRLHSKSLNPLNIE